MTELSRMVSAAAGALPADETRPRPTRAGNPAHSTGNLGDVILVLVVALCSGTCMLGQGPLGGTEPHRALPAHQMVVSGDWLIPRLLDQVYLAKPPLHYWILASFEKITGRADPFVWRLPSVIGGALTALILYLMSARWFGRLAGLVSGIGACGLLALWGQNRTAEIDAINTTMCVTATLLILDLGREPARGKPWAMIGAALTLSAALMLKGPASLPPIIGALVGPAIFNRDARYLKSAATWISVIAGTLIFTAYAAVTSIRFRALHLAPDTSGVWEVVRNLLEARGENLIHNLLQPVELFLYAMPVSLALLLAFHPTLWRRRKDGAERTAWRNQDRQLLRALVGTMAVALAITMLAGLVHPRYSYSWLPLICPVAGAVAGGWRRGAVPALMDEKVKLLLGISSICFAVATAVLCVIVLVNHPDHAWAYPLSATTAALLCAATLRLISRNELARAAWSIPLLILLAGIPYAAFGVQDRYRHSAILAAQELSQLVPAGQTVTTANLVWDDPELFYYAQLDVESHPSIGAKPQEFPDERWLVLNEDEYRTWSETMGARLVKIKQINTPDSSIFLTRYFPPQRRP